jgi:outer membrane protein TolC
MLQHTKKQLPGLVAGLGLLACTLFGTTAIAQQNLDKLTLEQVLSYTVQNNLTLQSAALDEKISREQTKEILATGLPQVNAVGDFKDYLKIPTSLLPAEIVGGEAGTFVPVQFGTQYNVTAGVEASQLLFSQSYLVGLKASKTAQEAAQLGTRKTKEEVVYATSLTFYSAQISRKQLDILRANLDKLIKQIQISDLQYQNGIIKKLDLDRLKVTRTNLETDIYNLETAHQQQLNMLRFYMNVPQTQIISLDTTINERGGGLLTMNRDVNLFQNRTEFQLLNKQKELYNLELKNIKGGYLPTLAAFASYNTMAMRSEFNFFQSGRPWFQTSVVGLRLNIPIFDGLEKRAKGQQSKLRHAKLENDSKMLKQSITMDITNANAKLINSRRALAAQKENRLLAEEVYTQTQLQYKEGLASMTDLLNAETSMRDAQNNYIRALIESLIADLELQKADGTLLKFTQE